MIMWPTCTEESLGIIYICLCDGDFVIKTFFLSSIPIIVKIDLDCQIFEIKIAYTLAHENVQDALTILFYLKE